MQYMEQLVTMKVYIDDCLHEHVPLKVVIGTHLHRKIAEAELHRIRDQIGELVVQY